MPPSVVGILLAAGRGTRFDPEGLRDKLLEPIDGSPVALHAYDSLAAHCTRVVAVVRPASARLARLLAARGALLVECAEADDGMGRSLAGGAAAVRAMLAREPSDGRTPGIGAVAVLPADLPWLQSATVARVIAALDRHDPAAIAAPLHRSRRGHPVVFGSAHLDALCRLDGDHGARALLQAFPVTLVDVDDDGILRDIDTQEDLIRG